MYSSAGVLFLEAVTRVWSCFRMFVVGQNCRSLS